MTPKEFSKAVDKLYKTIPEELHKYGPRIMGTIAVSEFKKNFQTESFNGKKWQEVQRRQPTSKIYHSNAAHHPVRSTRQILTGDTGDLGRSIEIKEQRQDRVTVWTAPPAFGSKEPYGKAHNEGLRAGRGGGFIMPKRQFMGETKALNERIIKELKEQLQRLMNEHK